MAPLKCCVGGCGSTSATHRLYCLPKDDQLRNLWMSHLVPRNSILLGLTKDQLINRRVCEKHFERHQLDRNGRRLQLSYPSLFTEEEIARGEPLPAPGEEVTEHSYCKNRDEVDDEDESMLVIGTAAGGSYLDHPSCSHSDTTKSAVMESLPVVDVLTHRKSSNPTPIIATPSSLQHTTLQPEAPANPTVKESSFKKFGSKQRQYIKKVKRITSESLGLTGSERLAQAENCASNKVLFQNFQHLSKQAQTFLIMQLRECRKNKMARRFSYSLDTQKKALKKYQTYILRKKSLNK